MLASMSYLSGDLPAVNASAIATKNAAETLKAADPLRGHLYSAVGTFFFFTRCLHPQNRGRC